jgi:alpha-N-arabinofuranosidase
MAIVNRHPDAIQSCSIKMGGKLLDGEFNATLLTGNSPEDYNDIENPDRVVPEKLIIPVKRGIVNLPPHSLVILNSDPGPEKKSRDRNR